MSQITTDFNDIDKITAVVCHPTPSLVVKHIVFLKRKIQAKKT
jgi:hypothetical protein